MSSTPPDVAPGEPKSPKHLAFVIDFGDNKTYDSQRHKALVEKFQNRHKRGQSLSKLEELPTSTPPSASKRQPTSGTLPRKSGFQTEGCFPCDERGDRNKNSSITVNKNTQYSRLRTDLKLPLKNVNSDKMTQSYPNGSITLSCIKSPELELQDVSSPELDFISPFSPLNVRPLSPLTHQGVTLPHHLPSLENAQLDTTIELSNINTNKFVDGREFDFNKSDTPSDAGTYTLETDNYTEEQKARMSIDRDFNIEQVSVKQRTEEYIQSLSKMEHFSKSTEAKKHKENTKIISKQSVCEALPNSSSALPKNIQEEKLKSSPIVSPTENLSITDKVNCIDKDKNIKSKEEVSNCESSSDKGCFTSITTSGVFGRKGNINIKTNGHNIGLTKSEVETQMYIDSSHKKNNAGIHYADLQEKEFNSSALSGALTCPNLTLNKISTLPPAYGGSSGKNSPTKIPSPLHSAFARPRSRNSVVDSDSSLETESFLKPTQNYINSLQKRLSLDSNHDSDLENKCNLRLNNELQKLAHIRHNSFDDKNLKVSNKLEHFQNKSLQGIDQTYINKFNQFSNSVHKIQNSPNNSPIQRSSSFSTNKNQLGNIQQKVTNLNISSVAKNNNLRNSPKLNQNNTVYSQSAVDLKPSLPQFGRSSLGVERSRFSSHFGDTESSSEDDFEKDLSQKRDPVNLTTTRYNRAFALRRARLDDQPQPNCPNTPEMRRKFQTADHLHSERAVSVDRRTIKTNSVSSRYMQNITKLKTADKNEIPKSVPKYTSEKPQILSRTDSGRLSMRSNKPVVSAVQKNTKDSGGKKQSGPRSNSSLSSREVEFQNWKRRKSYDPMRAAAEGKKKVERIKKECQNSMTQSYNENQQSQDCDSSPSHSSSVHRSQSFHGTAALAQLVSSEEEDDFTLSADEGFSPPAPSPYKLSPARMMPKQAWRDTLLN